jgi:antirestriction protein ArdC
VSKVRETYDRLVASFVAQLEAGTAPWVHPWADEGKADPSLPHNARSGRPYQGVNVLLLWAAGQAFGYPTNGWLTFSQAKIAGGHVRKGEHGQTVVFMKPLTKIEPGEDGEDHERAVMLLRGYSVFNVAQCEGLPDSLTAHAVDRPADLVEDDADAFIAATGAAIRRGGDRAFYSPSGDFIRLPERQRFRSRQHDQATCLHELGHWTGHERRLNRTFGQRFGDHAYAVEELVAELTAAFLCSDLGIEGQLQHAEYLANWAASLKARPNILWTASSKASAAAAYLKQCAGRPEEAGPLAMAA